MATDVILLQDVDDLGKMGDRVTVADGYARNYLFPRELGSKVTKKALQELEARKKALQAEHEERLAVAQSMAERINQESITIPMEATEEDKLYGSLTPKHIANVLKEKGIEVDSDSIKLEEPIRELGVFTVPVKLHEEVEASLKVWVVKQ